jgi:hypothetical protein
MAAALGAALPAGSAACGPACATAGAEIADAIITDKRKFRRCKYMILSLTWLRPQFSDTSAMPNPDRPVPSLVRPDWA